MAQNRLLRIPERRNENPKCLRKIALIMVTIIALNQDRNFTRVTCEPHYDHEDTSSHSKSVLCMKILESPLVDTFDRDLPMILLLQVRGRYTACHCPEK